MRKIGLKDEHGKFYFGWYVVIMGFSLMIFGYACIVSVSGVFTLPVTEDTESSDRRFRHLDDDPGAGRNRNAFANTKKDD